MSADNGGDNIVELKSCHNIKPNANYIGYDGEPVRWLITRSLMVSKGTEYI